jgi:hypothetical protein
MQVRSGHLRASDQPVPVLPCAQCGKPLLTPDWIEHLESHRVRYLWSCDACDYRFESIVRFTAESVPPA